MCVCVLMCDVCDLCTQLYVGGEAQRGDEERFIAALALIEQTYPVCIY